MEPFFLFPDVEEAILGLVDRKWIQKIELFCRVEIRVLAILTVQKLFSELFQSYFSCFKMV